MFYKLLFAFIFCLSNITFASSIKIRAIVGDDIITSYDVEQRKKLAKALLNHNKIKMTEEAIEQNVLTEMIDDKIKISEARKFNITVSADEIENAKSRMSQLLQLGPNGYKNILEEVGVSEDVLNDQIKGDIIWTKFTIQVLRSYIKVQDSEVNNFIETSSNGSFEYSLIPFILKNKDDVAKVKGIKDCSEFEKIATTYGEAGSGFKMNIVDSQMQDSLYNLTKSSPLLTPLKEIELNGAKTVFFICDKKAYVPTISNEEKEKIKYMIFQNKLDAYANKYFKKIKSTALIDIKN